MILRQDFVAYFNSQSLRTLGLKCGFCAKVFVQNKRTFQNFIHPFLFSWILLSIQRLVLLWTLEPADRDALMVNEATKWLTANNLVIVEIACTRTSLQLFKVRQAYHARFKKSLEEDVAYHTSGDIRKVTAIVFETFKEYQPTCVIQWGLTKLRDWPKKMLVMSNIS